MEEKMAAVLEMLKRAQTEGFGIGSFSPRNTFLIEYVLKAAVEKQSPVIIQISANEFNWFQVGSGEFGARYHELKAAYPIPSALHLDHTKDIKTIKEAIDAGFASVMIDASAQDFEENIRQTKEVVEYAHSKGVDVEAELGKIKSAADKLETDEDRVLYTDPSEAEEFAARTGVDYLAVSVGTAHGVYPVKNPRIDFERLERIRKVVKVPLVLHGGSGLPAQTVRKAIETGGISKVNIATDLEQAFLQSLGCERRLNREILLMDRKALAAAGEAVRSVAEEKMEEFVLSAGRAWQQTGGRP